MYFVLFLFVTCFGWNFSAIAAAAAYIPLLAAAAACIPLSAAAEAAAAAAA